jgi:hypothetical protein
MKKRITSHEINVLLESAIDEEINNHLSLSFNSPIHPSISSPRSLLARMSPSAESSAAPSASSKNSAPPASSTPLSANKASPDSPSATPQWDPPQSLRSSSRITSSQPWISLLTKRRNLGIALEISGIVGASLSGRLVELLAMVGTITRSHQSLISFIPRV